MPSGYPYTLDSLGSVQDNVDTVLATHVNSLRRLVEALETKVGVNSSADPNSLDYLVHHIPAPSPTVDVYGPPDWSIETGQVTLALRTAGGQALMDWRLVKVWVSLSDGDPNPVDVETVVSSVVVSGSGVQLPSSGDYVLDAITDANGGLSLTVTTTSSSSVYVWLAVGTQLFVSPDIQAEQN